MWKSVNRAGRSSAQRYYPWKILQLSHQVRIQPHSGSLHIPFPAAAAFGMMVRFWVSPYHIPSSSIWSDGEVLGLMPGLPISQSQQQQHLE